jgi:hypothetical protein
MANAIRGERMTLPTFTPTNPSVQALASDRLTPAGFVASNVGRAFRSAVAAVGKAAFTRVVYRAALRRLEARVEGNLFDEPILWAEIKSKAWAEAGEAAEQWKDRLPLIGAFASGVGFLLAIAIAALSTL